ncbi:hypothetical protein V6N13_129939 [Hibiscus sabdariffa]|uniref:Uncharacterized protein n=1 Tax=Hibiscus sabdariffa TaxID=183260 RepID=A0ABR2SNI9_9ROSI
MREEDSNSIAFHIRNPNHAHPPPPSSPLHPPYPNSTPIPGPPEMNPHAPSSGLASFGPRSSTRDSLTPWLIWGSRTPSPRP